MKGKPWGWIDRLRQADIAILQVFYGIAIALTPADKWIDKHPMSYFLPKPLLIGVFVLVGLFGLYSALTNRVQQRRYFLLTEVFLFLVASVMFLIARQPIGATTNLYLAQSSARRFLSFTPVVK